MKEGEVRGVEMRGGGGGGEGKKRKKRVFFQSGSGIRDAQGTRGLRDVDKEREDGWIWPKNN